MINRSINWVVDHQWLVLGWSPGPGLLCSPIVFPYLNVLFWYVGVLDNEHNLWFRRTFIVCCYEMVFFILQNFNGCRISQAFAQAASPCSLVCCWFAELLCWNSCWLARVWMYFPCQLSYVQRSFLERLLSLLSVPKTCHLAFKCFPWLWRVWLLRSLSNRDIGAQTKQMKTKPNRSEYMILGPIGWKIFSEAWLIGRESQNPIHRWRIPKKQSVGGQSGKLGGSRFSCGDTCPGRALKM